MSDPTPCPDNEGEVDFQPSASPVRGFVILASTLVVCSALYYLMPFEAPARKGLVLLLFVGVLWLTEAFHVTVTALIVPLGAVLLGLPDATTSKALAPFADPIIFLFFGGFALASALNIQRLDRKIALWILSMSRGNLGAASLMLFAATAVLSMWISNTATAAMMLPLALGIVQWLDTRKDRGTLIFILLGIAYSASIGGLGTLLGSPPNAIAAKALGLDFNGWLRHGMPLMLILLPLMVAVLWMMLRPSLNRRIDVPHEDIPWTTQRLLTMGVFVAAALAWVFGAPVAKAWNISSPDTVVALMAGLLVMMLGLASWRQVARRTDWGVLFLFGGGLALSEIMRSSGASAVLGDLVAGALVGASPLAIIVGVTAFIVILTEFTSNTASAALLVPLFAVISERMGMPPGVLVMMIGLGASCGFMLPVATPPNAIVFGTGQVRQADMLRVGVVLDILCIAVVSSWGYWVMS